MKTLENDLMATVEEWPATTLEERISRLEDVRSIGEVVAHYARCVDNRDGAGAASVFAEDGWPSHARGRHPSAGALSWRSSTAGCSHP